MTNKEREHHYWYGLEELKNKYATVFEGPTELPPLRGIYDHRIPLEPNVRTVNIQPYRLNKETLLNQVVQGMLDKGIIQDNCGHFASPVMLLGREDGIRDCVLVIKSSIGKQ